MWRRKHGKEKKTTFVSILRELWETTLKLPPPIRAICWVTFWSWIGWFPFLFYSSTWVGEIYLRYGAHNATSPTGSKNDALTEVGRVGSTSLVAFSFVSFICSLVLPHLARSVDDDDKPNFTPRPHKKLAWALKNFRLEKPSLAQAWTIANILFAVSMIWAPTVRSVGFATTLVTLCGVPWAIGGWASFAMIGAEINKLSSSSSSASSSSSSSAALPQFASSRNSSYPRLSEDSLELDSVSGSPRMLHVRHDSDASTAGANPTGELAGVYLGILNLYTTMPQFIGTGISTIVFSIVEPGKSPELAQDSPKDELHAAGGISGIGICLFIGAVCAGVAAWKCRDLGRG